MKICHLVASLEVGGMERVVCSLIKEQASRYELTSVFCTDSEGFFFQDVCTDHKECGFRKPSVFVVDSHVVKKLVRFLKVNEVQVIHAHNHLGLLYGAISSVLADLPLLVTMHGQGYGYSRKSQWLSKVCSLRAKYVVAISDNAKDVLLEKRMAPPRKIKVVKNGVDVNQFQVGKFQVSSIREQLGVPKDAFVIGSVGRLSSEKNYGFLISAFAAFLEIVKKNSSLRCPSLPSVQNPPRLLLVGDGPERESLEQAAKSLGIADSVIFAGMQNNVTSWLSCMDVFCLSSITEGTPMTLLEASVCGLPSVVSNVGGNAEVVSDGETGFVVDEHDEETYANAFERLYEDQSIRETMGKKAAQKVKESYSLESMLAQYEEIYKELVN